jgi:hypothetical protein
MDLSARTTIAPALGVDALGPQSLGRWVGHMRHGRFTHQDIADAPAIPHEAAIGIVAHYTIGLTLSTLYALLLRASKTRRGSLPIALAYGTATTIFSWFAMFPATGKGACRTASALCGIPTAAPGRAVRRLRVPRPRRSSAPAPRSPRPSTKYPAAGTVAAGSRPTLA